jgi:hypothetical protein
MRGGRVGPFTTANWLVRLKRADDYYGGYTTLPHRRTGVPCYCDGAPQGALWSAIENAADPMSYVASCQTLGHAAPQGLHCASTAEVLNGSCVRRPETSIEDTGGKYFHPGHIPPPSP